MALLGKYLTVPPPVPSFLIHHDITAVIHRMTDSLVSAPTSLTSSASAQLQSRTLADALFPPPVQRQDAALPSSPQLSSAKTLRVQPTQPLATVSTLTGPTAPEPLWAIDHQIFQALDFILDEVVRNTEPLPTSGQYQGACPDSGHVASVHRSPGGAYVFSIPPRSVLRSAPPVGGVKEPPGDEEPSSPDHNDMVATFAVTRSGHLLRAPSQLVLLLRDYTLTTRARYPAGCTFRIPDALGRQLAGVTAGRPKPALKPCAAFNCSQPSRSDLGGPAACCSAAHFDEALREGATIYKSAVPALLPRGYASNAALAIGLLDLLGDTPASRLPDAVNSLVNTQTLPDRLHAAMQPASWGTAMHSRAAHAHAGTAARGGPTLSALPHDQLFDTAKPVQASKRVARPKHGTRADPSSKRAKDAARWVRALLDVAEATGRPLTLDLLRPNIAFWRDVSEFFLRYARSPASISKYSAILNRLSTDLAAALGPSHPLYAELTANEKAPWHAEDFKQVQREYAAEVAARKTQAANAARLIETRSITQPSPTPLEALTVHESQALALPAYLLDDILDQALLHDSICQRISLRLATMSASEPQRKRRKARTPGLRLHSDDDIRKASHQDLLSQLATSTRLLGAAGAAFVQFCYMARASSIGGAREYNPGGSIHTDLDFTDQGMTYVIRFLKGWSPDTSVHGVRLPVQYARANTFPWEQNPDGSRADSKRNTVLAVIEKALSRAALSFVDCDAPETQASRKLTSALVQDLNLEGKLRPEDRSRMGKSQRVSSHSIRRAAVSMAMASGVSAPNIIRWVLWRDQAMPFTYVDPDYEVQAAWRSFFIWMLKRPEQNA